METQHTLLDSLDIDAEAKQLLIAKSHVRAVLTPEYVVNMLREKFVNSESFSFISERAKKFINTEKPEFRLFINISKVDQEKIIDSVNDLLKDEIFNPFSEDFRLLIRERNIFDDEKFKSIFKFSKEEISDIEDDIIAQLFMTIIKSDYETNDVILDDSDNIQVHVFYLW
jgi:hypothetical protein